jgi:ORF6N domain
MLDKDLAVLYETQTKSLEPGSKKKSKTVPKDFMFRLTKEEFENLRFQIETTESNSSGWLKRKLYILSGTSCFAGINFLRKYKIRPAKTLA